jgi:hypothetical protein
MSNEFGPKSVDVCYDITYWDGPLSGVCKRGGTKFYFLLKSEISFEFPEDDEKCKKILEENGEDTKQYSSLRIFELFDIPKEIMDIFEYNNQNPHDRKEVPEEFSNNELFKKIKWKYCIGYTTNEIWDQSLYNIKRKGKL